MAGFATVLLVLLISAQQEAARSGPGVEQSIPKFAMDVLTRPPRHLRQTPRSITLDNISTINSHPGKRIPRVYLTEAIRLLQDVRVQVAHAKRRGNHEH